jgi:hypothetical protein
MPRLPLPSDELTQRTPAYLATVPTGANSSW